MYVMYVFKLMVDFDLWLNIKKEEEEKCSWNLIKDVFCWMFVLKNLNKWKRGWLMIVFIIYLMINIK